MTFNQGAQGNVYLTGGDGQEDNTYEFDYNTSLEYCNPLEYSLPSPSKCSDWTFSPVALPTSPYMKSPLSSIGAYTDPFWDPFEQSFASVQSPVNNDNCMPSGYQAPYSSNTPGDTQPYVNLAAINETTAFDDATDDRNSCFTDETMPLPSPGINYYTREPSWGARRSSTSWSSSRPVSQPKRRKSSAKGSHSSHSHHRSKSDATTRLRSTQPSRSTTFSPRSTSPESQAVVENSKGRTNHNEVEKQYRNRLNGQFETLLSALPSENDRDRARSRVSKAEVLMLAKRHIVELEREKVMLEGKHHALESDVEDLKRRFVEMGGVCMP